MEPRNRCCGSGQIAVLLLEVLGVRVGFVTTHADDSARCPVRQRVLSYDTPDACAHERVASRKCDDHVAKNGDSHNCPRLVERPRVD